MDPNRASYFYAIVPSQFGEIGLVRRSEEGQFPICRILLPERDRPMAEIIHGLFPDAVPGRGRKDDLCRQLDGFLSGEAVAFRLDDLDFGGLSGFARRVLLADAEIPRGRVITYGRLAANVGISGGARAVGNVMAGNPFPLVIPCHRVVRSGGSLGGFGGGVEMKKALLRLEGVAFDTRGVVLPEHFTDTLK